MSRPTREDERFVWRSEHGRSFVPAVHEPFRWCYRCGSTWNPLSGNERPDACPRCAAPGCPEMGGGK